MTSQDQVAKLQLPNPSEIDDPNEDASSTSTTKIKGHVSRVAITNSREDLNSSQHTEYISPVQPILQSDNNAEAVDNLRKKSVTKINIGTILPGPELSIHDNNLLQQQQAQPYSKQKATEPTTIKTAQVSKVQQQQKTRQKTCRKSRATPWATPPAAKILDQNQQRSWATHPHAQILGVRRSRASVLNRILCILI